MLLSVILSLFLIVRVAIATPPACFLSCISEVARTCPRELVDIRCICNKKDSVIGCLVDICPYGTFESSRDHFLGTCLEHQNDERQLAIVPPTSSFDVKTPNAGGVNSGVRYWANKLDKIDNIRPGGPSPTPPAVKEPKKSPSRPPYPVPIAPTFPLPTTLLIPQLPPRKPEDQTHRVAQQEDEVTYEPKESRPPHPPSRKPYDPYNVKERTSAKYKNKRNLRLIF